MVAGDLYQFVMNFQINIECAFEESYDNYYFRQFKLIWTVWLIKWNKKDKKKQQQQR